MKCDVIAQGVITATPRRSASSCPLVVRLEGTNVELGKKMLGLGPRLIPASTYGDGAEDRRLAK
jgi:succinyl-CoA synthetase beta subunit